MGYAFTADLASALADSKTSTRPIDPTPEQLAAWEKRRPDAMSDSDAKAAADKIRAEDAITTGALPARIEPRSERKSVPVSSR